MSTVKLPTSAPLPPRGHDSHKRDFDILDPLVFAGWLLQQPRLSANLLQALRTIAGNHIRSFPAVTADVKIPGVSVRVELEDEK